MALFDMGTVTGTCYTISGSKPSYIYCDITGCHELDEISKFGLPTNSSVALFLSLVGIYNGLLSMSLILI